MDTLSLTNKRKKQGNHTCKLAKTCIPQDLVHRWDDSPVAWHWTAVKQRHCESPSCGTRKHCAPPTNQRSLDPALQNERRRLSTRLGQGSEESGSFFAPSAAHFSSQHDQPCPTSFTNKFWVRALLSAPGNFQCSTVMVCSPPPGASVAVQRGDQGGVDGQLGSMPKESPSATTSSRRPSTTLRSARSKSLT